MDSRFKNQLSRLHASFTKNDSFAHSSFGGCFFDREMHQDGKYILYCIFYWYLLKIKIKKRE